MDLGDGMMAKMEIRGIDEYSDQISKLGKKAVEISGKVVMAGADPVADAIRGELEKNLQGSEYSKGDLLDSFGIAPPGVDSQGNTNTKIGFEGYDREGTPNALKARAMESGTSTQKKRPFVRPAVNRVKARAIDAMGKTLEKEIKIYALKGK